jgi:hypothetical protein
MLHCSDSRSEAGEELSYHYGMLETEASFTLNHQCRCGAASCSGKWNFQLYRDSQHPLMYFAKPELKAKAQQLEQRWCNSNCYLRRIPCADSE